MRLHIVAADVLRKEYELKHYPFPKRLSRFFLETNDDCSFLAYKYNDKLRKFNETR